MSFNVQAGEALILRLTLPEQDDSKFVRAIVKDDTGANLTGSPFSLVNLGDGEYVFRDTVNLLFPANRLEVVALYQIYDDVDFLIPTVDYGQQAQDVFRNLDISVDGLGDSIVDLIGRVEKMVTDAITLRDDISIIIEDQEPIEVEVFGDDGIEIEVPNDEELEIELSQDETIELEVYDDEDIEVEISEDEV